MTVNQLVIRPLYNPSIKVPTVRAVIGHYELASRIVLAARPTSGDDFTDPMYSGILYSEIAPCSATVTISIVCGIACAWRVVPSIAFRRKADGAAHHGDSYVREQH